MALARPGASAPTSSVSNAQASANRSIQNANRAGSTAMQDASPSVPVEITGADGQHLVVSFDEVRRFVCDKATDTAVLVLRSAAALHSPADRKR